MPERRPTSTSNFGVGRREAHDAEAFYARFEPPEIADDAVVVPPVAVTEPFRCGDARRMDDLATGSVAFVVTSPPYFAGKQYEEELDRDGVPGSYLEYLDLLRGVFAECKRVLEPGGRIAVNVANLGRKPYRSLSADVIRILQDDLRLLLRGEVVWRKGDGANGSCAWGSFRSPANPVLRDLTERVVIASKGRFDRAIPASKRARAHLPHKSSLSSDEFMAATLDVWEIPPESATRVGHPAPFPVELPERLIRLFTYEGDLVLDPFMGSGSALAAAARTGRRYVGYDLDPAYVKIARARVEEETRGTELPGSATAASQDRAAAEGRTISALSADLVERCGFTLVNRDVRQRGLGLVVDLVATDATGVPWYFEVSGGYTTVRAGLFRTETALRAVGRAHVLARSGARPVVLLTSHLPRTGSDADLALRAAGSATVHDVFEILSEEAESRLTAYAKGGAQQTSLPGFWSTDELVGAKPRTPGGGRSSRTRAEPRP